MKADKPFVSAVIAGAGRGTRMGGANKALVKIGGKTAFRLVLEAFGAVPLIDEIVVVCRDGGELAAESADFSAKPLRFTRGGKTRAESVLCGVKAASGKARFYCIHDCARPLVTPETIEAVVKAAFESGAAAACTPVTDTVKYVNSENGTVYTPERRHLLAVQTPQVFERKLYAVSAALAKKDGFAATDDTSIVEHAGFRVSYVQTSRDNIKLTCAADVCVARELRRLEELKEKTR